MACSGSIARDFPGSVENSPGGAEVLVEALTPHGAATLKSSKKANFCREFLVVNFLFWSASVCSTVANDRSPTNNEVEILFPMIVKPYTGITRRSDESYRQMIAIGTVKIASIAWLWTVHKS